MKKQESAVFATMLKKLDRGDPVSDDEIDLGITFLESLFPFLFQLGERYTLMANDLYRKLDILKGYKRERTRDKRANNI